MNIQKPTRGANQSLDTAVAEAETRYASANPKSRALYEAARANLPGGNTRTTVYFSPFPLYMAGGEGGTLTDVDGHRYLDFINEYTAGLFGHSHPVVREAVTAALASGVNLGAPTEGEIRLSAALRARFPALELLRFCNSGTEANLLALATARAATGREAVMVFDGAYHGSLYYFSHGASPLNMPIPTVFSTFNDVDAMRRDIAAHAATLAAVIVEPMQGGAGALPGTAEFLRALREETARHGVCLVFDEVMTSAHPSRRPPGALWHPARPRDAGEVSRRRYHLRRVWRPGRDHGTVRSLRPHHFPHGGTFNNNVLAMTAGARVMDEVLTDDALNAMNGLGDGVRDGVNALARRHGLPVQATGVGSIFGIHFHDGAIRNIADLDAGEHGREAKIAALKKLFHLDLFEAGIYISRRVMGNLSLATTAADTQRLLDAVDEFMASRANLVREAVTG